MINFNQIQQFFHQDQSTKYCLDESVAVNDDFSFQALMIEIKELKASKTSDTANKENVIKDDEGLQQEVILA